jgi:hypothetical protein
MNAAIILVGTRLCRAVRHPPGGRRAVRRRDCARRRHPRTLAFGLVGIGRERPLFRLVAGAAFLFVALMFFLSYRSRDLGCADASGEQMRLGYILPSSTGAEQHTVATAEYADANPGARRRATAEPRRDARTRRSRGLARARPGHRDAAAPAGGSSRAPSENATMTPGFRA